MTRLIIRYHGEDVSNAVEITNRRGNPFGWSACDIQHGTTRVAMVESGFVMLTDEAKALGYTHEEVNEP